VKFRFDASYNERQMHVVIGRWLFQGNGDGSFVEIYSGPQKQYKVTRLSPSTSYAFRLAAVNSVGQRLVNVLS